MSDVGTLTDYGLELLDVCEAAVATTIGGPIDRAFLVAALPALDCSQLTVHIAGLGAENTTPTTPVTAPSHRLVTTGMLILAAYVVTVVRCHPVSEQPTPPAVLQAAAIEIDQDLWAIWNAVSAAHNAGTLFGGRCPAIYFDPPTPLLVEGGLAGWEIPFRAAIDGYTP